LRIQSLAVEETMKIAPVCQATCGTARHLFRQRQRFQEGVLKEILERRLSDGKQFGLALSRNYVQVSGDEQAHQPRARPGSIACFLHEEVNEVVPLHALPYRGFFFLSWFY
jgi:hypothetical protein